MLWKQKRAQTGIHFEVIDWICCIHFLRRASIIGTCLFSITRLAIAFSTANHAAVRSGIPFEKQCSNGINSILKSVLEGNYGGQYMHASTRTKHVRKKSLLQQQLQVYHAGHISTEIICFWLSFIRRYTMYSSYFQPRKHASDTREVACGKRVLEGVNSILKSV